MIGKILAHYEITSQIGKGGMGEVYQAKDTKLGRDVAIKVLPEEFAKDADRVARFQREAKLLASLNHPNIAAIYGLEESDGTHFLVMELIEGQTIAERIKGGPIPVEESLKLALQITEALEAAHEKSVIHRDLKPANIKVTPDGKVKVLDFGLAKAFASEQQVNLSNSPTLSDMATQQGVILGTAAYMSPEQAKGKSVDKRADIWAFGVVLFEMLTGRQLFSGESVSETLAAVIKSEPEWNNLPPNLHPRIRLMLERCLEKEPKKRYSGINDAWVDIEKVLADPSGVLVEPITTAKPKKKLRLGLPWIAAAIILTTIITITTVWYLKPNESRQIIRLTHQLPEGQRFSNIQLPLLAVSPDGTQFVYSTNEGLYLRSLEEIDARLIPGTDENPAIPFFSPDGRWIGYFTAGNPIKLKKITIDGGAPQALCDIDSFPTGASWGADDTIVYAEFMKGIKRVSAKGGTPETIIESAGIISFPQILPDGKSVLYTDASYTPNRIMVQSFKSEEPKQLVVGTRARYLPTGYLVYAVEDNLFAGAFDLYRLEVAGGSGSLVEGIANGFHYDLSDSGTLVYVPGTVETSSTKLTLWWVDRQGKEEALAAEPNSYSFPRISPDGTKVALTIADGDKSDIWIWDIDEESWTRLTFNESSGVPLWTLDGQRVAFMKEIEGEVAIYWKAADGSGNEELIGSGPNQMTIPGTWSSDGKTLLTMDLKEANWDIGSLSMEGDKTYKPLLQEEHIELQPEISPDGQWMAYMSDESGEAEIYVRPFPDLKSGGQRQVSTGGGNSPLWSIDGSELFYRKGNEVMAVSVETEPNFKKRGNPETLFQREYVRLNLRDAHTCDIHPINGKFLMMKQVGATDDESAPEDPRKIIVITNWFEELKQKVPLD